MIERIAAVCVILASTIVERYWPAVVWLATALVEHGSMTGDQAIEIIGPHVRPPGTVEAQRPEC